LTFDAKVGNGIVNKITHINTKVVLKIMPKLFSLFPQSYNEEIANDNKIYATNTLG